MDDDKISYINIEQLSDKDLEMVAAFIELLKKRKEISPIRKDSRGKIIFSVKRSNVIGLLNREEIYDYF